MFSMAGGSKPVKAGLCQIRGYIGLDAEPRHAANHFGCVGAVEHAGVTHDRVNQNGYPGPEAVDKVGHDINLLGAAQKATVNCVEF